MRSKRTLLKLAASAGINLTEEGIEKLVVYADEIIKWNAKVALISKKDESRIIERHIFESMLLSKVTSFSNEKMLDMGAGSGLPGIPLKIMYSDVDLILIDSQRKKTIFLQHIIKLLNLKNVEVLCSRLEEPALVNELRSSFDVVTARALAPLNNLLSWAEPYLKNAPGKKGMCIFPKGEKVSQELEAVDQTNWEISLTDMSGHLPGNHGERALSIVTAVKTIT